MCGRQDRFSSTGKRISNFMSIAQMYRIVQFVALRCVIEINEVLQLRIRFFITAGVNLLIVD